jgi:hypothetical protein
MLPRGIRLNNPLNIRHSASSWVGQSTMQDDPAFVRFDRPQDGLRAGMKILLNYQIKYGLHTVGEMIARWAPPSENPTASYKDAVAQRMGVDPDEVVSLHDRALLMQMTQAMSLQENGHPPTGLPLFWFAPDVYADAADMALGLKV